MSVSEQGKFFTEYTYKEGLRDCNFIVWSYVGFSKTKKIRTVFATMTLLLWDMINGIAKKSRPFIIFFVSDIKVVSAIPKGLNQYCLKLRRFAYKLMSFTSVISEYRQQTSSSQLSMYIAKLSGSVYNNVANLSGKTFNRASRRCLSRSVIVGGDSFYPYTLQHSF